MSIYRHRGRSAERILKVGCALLLLSFLLSALPVGAKTETPRSYAERIANLALGVIKGVDREKAGEEFAKNFYMPVFSRRCLKDHWDKLTETQRIEFIAVFACNLRERLSRVISDRYKDKKIKYAVGAPIVQKEGLIKVELKAKVDNTTDLDFVYFIMKTKDGYKLVDYEAEGALLSRQYRGHFNYLMRKYGFEGMIRKMRDKFIECRNAGLSKAE